MKTVTLAVAVLLLAGCKTTTAPILSTSHHFSPQGEVPPPALVGIRLSRTGVLHFTCERPPKQNDGQPTQPSDWTFRFVVNADGDPETGTNYAGEKGFDYELLDRTYSFWYEPGNQWCLVPATSFAGYYPVYNIEGPQVNGMSVTLNLGDFEPPLAPNARFVLAAYPADLDADHYVVYRGTVEPSVPRGRGVMPELALAN